MAVCKRRTSFAHASSVKQLEKEGVVIISLGADLSSAARDAATSRVNDPVARSEAASNKSLEQGSCGSQTVQHSNRSARCDIGSLSFEAEKLDLLGLWCERAPHTNSAKNSRIEIGVERFAPIDLVCSHRRGTPTPRLAKTCWSHSETIDRVIPVSLAFDQQEV